MSAPDPALVAGDPMPNLTPADWAEVAQIRKWAQDHTWKTIRFYADSIHLLLRALDERTAERDRWKDMGEKEHALAVQFAKEHEKCIAEIQADQLTMAERENELHDAKDALIATLTAERKPLTKAILDDLDLIERGHLDLVRVVRERLKGFMPGAPHAD